MNKEPTPVFELIESFRDLVERHRAEFRRRAASVLGRTGDADDVIQTAFCEAWRHLGSFGGRASMHTWLRTIVVNTARRHSVKRARVAALEASVAREAPMSTESSQWALPSADRDAQRRRLTLALRDLPRDQRRIVYLRDLHGLDTAQTARRLGIGTGAARVRLHRAHTALRVAFAGH